MTSILKFNKVFKTIAPIKNIINLGNLDAFACLLNIQFAINISGISHIVLPNFNVAATFADSPPKVTADPITELVSWIASADQAPNSKLVISR